MGSVHPKPSHKEVEGKEAVTSQKNSLYYKCAAWFCDSLESAFVRVFYDSKRPANYYISSNYGPVEEFGPERALSVEGTLPECLNGEFVRVGPNPKYKPVANYHWFDGDGMLHGVRIQDGKVNYVCRYVKTERLKQETFWGGPKFMKLGDLWGKAGLFWANLYKLRVKLGILDLSKGNSTANTALVYHNGQLLSLNEFDRPYAIRVLEDGDLETIGRLDYDKKLNHAFTAHPKVDPDTGEMFTFCYQVDAPPHAVYRYISKDGVMEDPVPLTLSGPIMMHDFAITENYSIFMDCPLYFNPKNMVAKDDFIFTFDKTKPARFGVLPRYAKNESQMRWFDLSNCVILHNANAWEEGDEVVLVTCRLPSIDLGAISKYDEKKAKEFFNDLWEYQESVQVTLTMSSMDGQVHLPNPVTVHIELFSKEYSQRFLALKRVLGYGSCLSYGLLWYIAPYVGN